MSTDNLSAFQKAYQQLNEDQKKAVDHIYGPIMAIAGPGTGKTQLLAVRVCNIIANTDMSANNILCLTFTDAGAKAMRNRLLSFMGPDAYHVGVHTYHSFCNQVIRENPDKFSDYRELQNASDLEMVDVMTELIDSLPLDHELKRLKGNIYYDIPRINNLFNVMKQEGWTPDDVIKAIKEHEENLPFDENFQYKRKYKEFQKGDPKVSAIKKEMGRYQSLLHAAPLIEEYKKLLKKRDRIDYNDSILFVIKALKEDDMLLAYYQERYQFMLADEYQDTNGTQNELLFLLNSYDDKPNLFVVGDDDQAIYRFQGANMNNILEFKNKFDPVEIVLDKNYRSAQPILNAAMELINHNKERLAYNFKNLTKDLKESRIEHNGEGAKPIIMVADSPQAQDVFVLNEIKKLHQRGVAYKDIGIIYRKHKEVADLVKYMTYNDIPINVKKRVDVLQLNDIKKIIKILHYLQAEFVQPHSEEALLFEILHFSFFNLKANDIAKVSLYCAGEKDENGNFQRKNFRDVIGHKTTLVDCGVDRVETFQNVSNTLEKWIGQINDVTIQVLFEKILTQSGLLSQVLNHPDKTWRLQVINTLFNFIKEETSTNPDLTLKELMEMIQKMKDHRIAIPISYVISSNEGINFMTAHSSKGLEFEYVFIINAADEMWLQENNRSSGMSFRFPPTILLSSDGNDTEDDRRLFYVALTRAKNFAYITYPKQSSTDKVMTPVRFIPEMKMEGDVQIAQIENHLVDEYLFALMKYEQGEAQLIDKDYIDRIVETMYMSATGITKYIRCKTSFYFENILRVPMARTANMGYGNAIHYALERFIIKMNETPDRKLPDVDVLLKYFKQGMEKFKSHFTKDEYDASVFNGEKTLPIYYDQRKSIWKIPRSMKTEYKIQTEYNGIPISGIIDRVDIHDHHIDITDYKTGAFKYDKLAKADPDRKTNPEGGDYWRQVVFYKMLIDKDTRIIKRLNEAIMDFVQPKDEEVKDKRFKGEDFDIPTVAKQLQETYHGIKAYNFSPGCNEPDCKWCNFVKENMELESPLAGENEEEIEMDFA